MLKEGRPGGGIRVQMSGSCWKVDLVEEVGGIEKVEEKPTPESVRSRALGNPAVCEHRHLI